MRPRSSPQPYVGGHSYRGRMDELTERDTEILDFERTWWKYAGARDAAIRARFGVSSVRHSQIVNALIDRPAAEAWDPATVRRLRRLRQARREARGGCVYVHT
jgi:hypothetical protein